MNKLGFLLLSGGRSSRMGMPKALVEIDGKTMISRIAQAGKEFDERIFSVNDPDIPTPQGFARVSDVYQGCGPMGGLHAALTYTHCDALVTAPCDAPRYSAALAKLLAETYAPDIDAVILVGQDGRAHPLMGIYSKRCLPALKAHLDAGHLKLMRMLDTLNTRRIVLPEDFDSGVLCNLNTPEEVRSFCEHGKA